MERPGADTGARRFMLWLPLLATTHLPFIYRRTQATSNAGFCPECCLFLTCSLNLNLSGTTSAAPASAPWQHLAGPPFLNLPDESA